MNALPEWIDETNFGHTQREIARHQMKCPLRLALVTDGKKGGDCTCGDKRKRAGIPRCRSLADLKRKFGGGQ